MVVTAAAGLLGRLIVARRKVGVALLATVLLGAAPVTPVDLLIRGGAVYSGDAVPFTGDVAVRGDRIAAVGRRLTLPARRVVDARGLFVAPGFIDPHTHVGDDLANADAAKRLIPMFLLQGVTTAFIGNDGNGEPEVAATLSRATRLPVGINYATWVGFGAVRARVMGMADRAPLPAELTTMRGLVAKAMCEGALGLSTGLFYAPQSFATTDEVVELAREAASRGGRYDSHIRDESSYSVGLAAAVEEVLTIGREAKIPVHIAHIKALGVDVWGQAPAIIAKVRAARAAGIAVTADQYPWEASGTSLVASLVPRWAQDGGRAAMLARFENPALRPRLVTDMRENLRKRGGADKLLITEGPMKGRTLADATGTGDAILEAVTIILIGDPAVISFNQRADDIAAFMREPWVMTGSDASPGHPRLYGSFARKWAQYVRADKLLTPREFVMRSSTLTARTFVLKDRGELRPGAFADIVVFDPRHYAARATYAAPTLSAAGVHTVVVNGRIAVENGKLTGVAAGRALAKTPPAGSCP